VFLKKAVSVWRWVYLGGMMGRVYVVVGDKGIGISFSMAY